MMTLVSLVLALAAPAAAAQGDKKDPQFNDKENGFSLYLPTGKGQIEHWEIAKPEKGDEFAVRITCDLARPCEIAIYVQPWEGSYYDALRHVEQFEESIKKGRQIKKATRKKLETVTNFTGDRVSAGHLWMEAIGEADAAGKMDVHCYAFRSQRNKAVYSVVMYVEAGALEKQDKNQLGRQVQSVLSSIRTFPIKK
jgi:hypothetical protein